MRRDRVEDEITRCGCEQLEGACRAMSPSRPDIGDKHILMRLLPHPISLGVFASHLPSSLTASGTGKGRSLAKLGTGMMPVQINGHQSAAALSKMKGPVRKH